MPAAQYYYCPFAPADVDNTTRNTQAKYTIKADVSGDWCVICPPQLYWKSGGFIVINGPNTGALGDVPNDSVLLIDGHGSQGGSLSMACYDGARNEPVIVPARSGNTERGITPTLLADLIEREKLDKGHLAVRMLSCFGAGPAAAYTGTNLKDQLLSDMARDAYQAEDFFARALAVALKARKYNAVRVAGYRGRAMNSTNMKNWRTRVETVAGGDTYSHAHSDKAKYMAWYDGDGNLTTKPTGLRKFDKLAALNS